MNKGKIIYIFMLAVAINIIFSNCGKDESINTTDETTDENGNYSTTFSQVGSDIQGKMQSDHAGYSVSMPNSNTLAYGAAWNCNNCNKIGFVRVFTLNGTEWVQKGLDIAGEEVDDFTGLSVSMPDDNTLAFGAPRSDYNGESSGHICIYNWNGTKWVPKGGKIVGDKVNDIAGHSVSMPNSNTVAVGAPGNNTYASRSYPGFVRIYSWSGEEWTQKGAEIVGKTSSEHLGYSISMPDENTIAIGAKTTWNFDTKGIVRIYQWNGLEWVQKGRDIKGEDYYYSGWIVSMPDANTIAVGAPEYYSKNSNNISEGIVSIYVWDGSTWMQKGSDIEGKRAHNAASTPDNLGYSVSMPNSNTVAVGAPHTGHVRIYNWEEKEWVQKSPDLEGKSDSDQSKFDEFGYSVSMPNSNTVAVGAPDLMNFSDGSGYVRIFSLDTP